ncbi:alpha/beta fold hydrolase [Thalassobius sp. MITS945101]|uniref:alpha/beta fold hydrolase n=1 Tax=Thalassobius sp. MITS945101 TaxID=3096994 RepID=UPI00399B400A
MSNDVLDRGTGPVIVFLHNAATDYGLWKHQIEEFAPAYRVIAPNLPGHGTVPSADTVAAMADHIETDLHRRGVREFALVGLCLGGMVAVELASRPTNTVTSLTLIETLPRETDGRWALRLGERLFSLAGGIPPWFADLLSARRVSANSAAARQFKRDALRRMTPQSTLAVVRAVLNYNGSAVLRRLQIPTLFLVGEHNRSRHEAALHLAEHLEAAEVVMIPRSGQLVALEAPTMVNNALRQFWHRAARPTPLLHRLRPTAP